VYWCLILQSPVRVRHFGRTPRGVRHYCRVTAQLHRPSFRPDPVQQPHQTTDQSGASATFFTGFPHWHAALAYRMLVYFVFDW